MICLTLLRHDLKNLVRRPTNLISLLTFVIVSSLLFPLAIGPEPQVLSRLASGLIWVLILFSSHLMAPHVWHMDIEDGTLQQLLLSQVAPEWIILSKAICIWLTTFGSLLLITPLTGLSLGLEPHQILTQTQTLLLISLPLSFLTLTGGLMTHNDAGTTLLSTIILLPIYLPLLIFSTGSCDPLNPYSIKFSWMLLVGIGLFLCVGLLYLNTLLLRWQKSF